MQALEREFKPLLTSRLMVQNHPFKSTRTGVRRRADFFADSYANVALDVLRLNLRDEGEIIKILYIK
jgi:hypothetical protein